MDQIPATDPLWVVRCEKHRCPTQCRTLIFCLKHIGSAKLVSGLVYCFGFGYWVIYFSRTRKAEGYKPVDTIWGAMSGKRGPNGLDEVGGFW